jgi:hypothetical protein
MGKAEALRSGIRLAASLIGIAGLAGSLAGCADMAANTNSEVVSSIRFDNTPCNQLISQRNALVAQYGSPDALPEGQKPGERPYLKHEPLGMFLAPDFRSKSELERRKELGRIDAMNHSIERRQCEGASKGKAKKPGLG